MSNSDSLKGIVLYADRTHLPADLYHFIFWDAKGLDLPRSSWLWQISARRKEYRQYFSLIEGVCHSIMNAIGDPPLREKPNTPSEK